MRQVLTNIARTAAFAWCLAFAAPARAQHPIEVERLAAQGEYLKALTLFDELPTRIITVSSRLAAAKAAWALSLPQRAEAEYDRALREGGLDDVQRARVLLAKGIIEFQEFRPQVAAMYAEKVIDALPGASPLRSRALTLWGQALYEQHEYAGAEAKLLKALDESGPQDRAEVHFSLGLCDERLGKNAEARDHFESVPLEHDRTPDALRELARLALDDGKPKEAALWLNKGRTAYPDRFLDSWVDYALLQIAVKNSDDAAVHEIRDAAVKKYPPSDGWLDLLLAAAEAYEWRDASGEMKARPKQDDGVVNEPMKKSGAAQ
jgi:tetratricopeptide (TPR) repeat protein